MHFRKANHTCLQTMSSTWLALMKQKFKVWDWAWVTGRNRVLPQRSFLSNERTTLWDNPKEPANNMAQDYNSSDITGNLPRNWQFWWNPKKLGQINFIIKTKHDFPNWHYDPIICIRSLCIPIWYMKFLRGHVLAGSRWTRYICFPNIRWKVTLLGW